MLLKAITEENDWHLRYTAVRDLGEVGEAGRVATPVLIKLLQSQIRELREGAATALLPRP